MRALNGAGTFKRGLVMSANAVARVATMKNLIMGQKDRIAAILPKHITPERMLRVMQNAISKNPKLLECTDTSIVAAIVVASELGLEPNTPLQHCFIIPYSNWNKERKEAVMEATLQIGYPGLMLLAENSGRIKAIYPPETVHENDDFRIERGMNPKIHHVDAKGARGPVTGFYVVAQLQSSMCVFDYMSADEVQAHAEKFSKSYYKFQSKQDRQAGKAREIDPEGFYHKHPVAYGKKTVIRRICKYLPKSIEDKLTRALSVEEASGRLTFDPKTGAVDVNFSDVTPTDPGAPDPRKDLMESARAVIAKFNDIVPGGVTLDDIEGATGGPLASAPAEEVREAINTIKLKCQLIVEMTDQLGWRAQGRALDLTAEELDALFSELKKERAE